MSPYCNEEAKRVQAQWRQAKQACAEVEQRLGALQRVASAAGSQELAALQDSYYFANDQVRKAQVAIIALANSCFE